jgi:hypothetical protein
MDIEGTMQFILDQQAQTHLILDRTNETLANLAERHNKLEQIVLELGQTMLGIANAQQHASEVLSTLAERQVATEEAISRLAERQGTTEESLNVLLLTVERHISNHN